MGAGNLSWDLRHADLSHTAAGALLNYPAAGDYSRVRSPPIKRVSYLQRIMDCSPPIR